MFELSLSLWVEGEQLEIGDLRFWKTVWVAEKLDTTHLSGLPGPWEVGECRAWKPGGPFAATQLGLGQHSQAPVLQANNDILAFLSGMPVTRNTKYLDLKNSVSGYHPYPTLSAALPFPGNDLRTDRPAALVVAPPLPLREAREALQTSSPSAHAPSPRTCICLTKPTAFGPGLSDTELLQPLLLLRLLWRHLVSGSLRSKTPCQVSS